MEWVSRIVAVSLVMVLPGIAGFYLDQKLGTEWIGLLGFGFGMVLGMSGLFAMLGVFKPRK